MQQLITLAATLRVSAQVTVNKVTMVLNANRNVPKTVMLVVTRLQERALLARQVSLEPNALRRVQRTVISPDALKQDNA